MFDSFKDFKPRDPTVLKVEQRLAIRASRTTCGGFLYTVCHGTLQSRAPARGPHPAGLGVLAMLLPGSLSLPPQSLYILDAEQPSIRAVPKLRQFSRSSKLNDAAGANAKQASGVSRCK